MTGITRAEYDARLIDAMKEKELQDLVEELARRLGWLVYHTYDSRRSAAGFPDLVMVRHGRLIFAELKRQQGRVTPKQREWLQRLEVVSQLAGGDLVEVHEWRPTDWFDRTIYDALNDRVDS